VVKKDTNPVIVLKVVEVEVVEGASVFNFFTKIPGHDLKLHPHQYFEFSYSSSINSVIQVALTVIRED